MLNSYPLVVDALSSDLCKFARKDTVYFLIGEYELENEDSGSAFIQHPQLTSTHLFRPLITWVKIM